MHPESRSGCAQICPLMNAGDLADCQRRRPAIDCRAQECAWWDEKELMCAVRLLPTLLKPILEYLATPYTATPPFLVQRGIRVTEQDGTLHITKED